MMVGTAVKGSGEGNDDNNDNGGGKVECDGGAMNKNLK